MLRPVSRGRCAISSAVCLEPIRTTSVAGTAVERILQAIDQGVWKAGDRLPPQRTLASQLSISMASLREALQALQGMGILESRPGAGTFVSSGRGQIVDRCLNLALHQSPEDVYALLGARFVIERGLAYLAATRASEEQISEAEQLVEAMRDGLETGDQSSMDDLDLRYHELMAEMGSNHILRYLGKSLFSAISDFIHIIPHTREGVRLHAAVVEAIRARDPLRSESAMTEMMERTERVYRQLAERKATSDSSPRQ